MLQVYAICSSCLKTRDWTLAHDSNPCDGELLDQKQTKARCKIAVGTAGASSLATREFDWDGF